MIFVTGDTHIPIDIHKLNSKNFVEQKVLTKQDYVIVCGDFGLYWNNIVDKTELYWLRWLNEKRFTTLFIDGNHENHKRLFSGMLPVDITDNDEYKIEKKFDGFVGKLSDSIFHLRRGEVYTIDNKKFFVMGGAYSIDKLYRKLNISWWEEEELNNKELNYGLDNLYKNNNEVDYILCHTAPISILTKYIDRYWEPHPTEKYLEHIINNIRFKSLYCGHMHVDKIYEGKYHLLYNNIIKID